MQTSVFAESVWKSSRPFETVYGADQENMTKPNGGAANATPPFWGGLGSVAAATAATAVVVVRGVAAAGVAAGDQDHSKDDQPNPVIMKKIAETAIHKSFLRFHFEGGSPPFCYHHMRRRGECAWILSNRERFCYSAFSKGQTSPVRTGSRRYAKEMAVSVRRYAGSSSGPQELEPMPLCMKSTFTTVSSMGTSSKS